MLGFAALIFVSASAFADDGKPAAGDSKGDETIVVEGNKRVEAATVRSYFRANANGRYDEAARDTGLKALIETRLFDNISVDRSGGRLIVHVHEAPILGKVAFEGNKRVKDTDLTPVIDSKPGGSLQRAVVQSDVNKIIEAYKHLGRDDVSVKPVTIDRGNDRVDLVFEVTEGVKTPVRQISFVGNTAFGRRQLAAVIKTSQSSFLSFITGGDVYDPDIVNNDRELLRNYYRRKGYADVNVPPVQAEYDPATKGFTLTYTIEEGPLYRFGDVTVDSHVDGVDPGKLRRLLTVQQGATFDGSALDRNDEKISAELARLGYPFSRVQSRTTRDEAGKRIDIAFIIDQGPRAYIERINIHGNLRTRDYVIRREFDIGEGDPYNHALIERGERRLNNLDYFKSVHISTRPGSAPDRVIVTIQVEDKPTGSVSVSGGYSTLEGPLVEVAFTETNFLGRGEYVRLSATRGLYSNGWGVTFTEPYLFDQRLAGGFDLYHKQQLENIYALYATTTTGINLRLGVPITEELTFQPNYSLYSSQITIPNDSSLPYGDCNNPTPLPDNVWGGSFTTAGQTAPQAASIVSNCLLNGEASAAIKEAAAQGQIITSLVGYSLIWDSLDNRKNPTQGAHAEFHQDIAGLGGNSDFVRETIDGKVYYPITDDFVGMLRVQGGRIDQIGSGFLPLVDNFNLGPTLVRGFAPGGIGPRDISDPNNIYANSLGGTTYFGGTAEVQFPIFGLPREVGLKGALFVDAGTLTGYSGQSNLSSLLGYNYCSVNGVYNYPKGSNGNGTGLSRGVIPLTQPSCVTVDDENVIRTSVGASLIWASPMGPIRIDFALPIIKGKYDQVQYVNFSGGATF